GIWFYIPMSQTIKRTLVGIVLTCIPVATVRALKQSAWGTALSTPRPRQWGEPGARVTIFEYSDFQCPACARVQPTVHQLMDLYKGKVRLAFKYYPLMMIHKNALPSAHAAQCAAEQNQFWPYADKLFATQTQWAGLSNATTSFMAIAQEVTLDAGKFST